MTNTQVKWVIVHDDINYKLDALIQRRTAKLYKQAREILKGKPLSNCIEKYKTRNGDRFTEELSRKVRNVDLFRFNTKVERANIDLAKLANEIDDLYRDKHYIMESISEHSIAKTLLDMKQLNDRQNKEREKVAKAVKKVYQTIDDAMANDILNTI